MSKYAAQVSLARGESTAFLKRLKLNNGNEYVGDGSKPVPMYVKDPEAWPKLMALLQGPLDKDQDD